MKLVDVYDGPKAADVLYELLAERPAKARISHRKMPTRADHENFVASRPYLAWYLIEVDGDRVGAIYLTHANEVGVGIFRQAQRRGYATAAIRMLMERHPRESFRANINPDNRGSIEMFARLGFVHVQNTYERHHA